MSTTASSPDDLSDARFRGLLEAAPDAMVITDREGRIVLVNGQTEALFGYRREELLGHRVEMLIPERFRGPHPEHGGGYFSDARRLDMRGLELFALRKDGTEFPVEITLSPKETEEGTLVTAAMRDVSERKRLEAERRRSEEELAGHRRVLAQTEKIAAMGSLLAGVAHELNNPLSVVLGQAGLLERATAGGPQAARARKIAEAAERCARIVTSFLSLARQRPPERREVDLGSVVREALELLAYSLRAASVDVELALAADLPRLWADPHQLQQVVVHLVTNARDAMRGPARPRMLMISAYARSEGTRVVLEVADTGPGIPPEARERLFEPFFTTKPAGEGTGLGLSLCRGIVLSHGGSLSLENGDGGGATFRIELPVESPPAEAVRRLAHPAAASVPSGRILVVDDEPLVAEVVAEMLTDVGQSAVVALTAAAALDALSRASYDLILSDIRMPEMDGPTFFREVTRRNPALARRFLFLTGDSLSADVAAFLRESGVPSLSKPFTSAELLAAVRAAFVR